MIESCFFNQIFCCLEAPTIVGKDLIHHRQSVAYL